MSFQKTALCFLGTAAQSPNLMRNVSCLGFQEMAKGNCWLFDCGEGTQRQILFFNNKVQQQRMKSDENFPNDIKFKNINKIFITHLHADHIYGLPPLLCSLNIVNKTSFQMSSETPDSSSIMNPSTIPPIEIYGPNGLFNYLKTCIQTTGTVLHVPIKIIELINPKVRTITPLLNRNKWIQYEQIKPDSDGFYNLFDNELCSVTSGIVNHGRSYTYGYVIQEKNTQGNININAIKPILDRNRDQLKLMGIYPAEILLKSFKEGKTIKLPDGTILSPKDTQLLSKPTKGRKYTIIGDTDNANSLIPLCLNTDVLLHECTIGPTLSDIYRNNQNMNCVNYFKQYEQQLGKQWYMYKNQREMNEFYTNKTKHELLLSILSDGYFYETYHKWACLAGHSTSTMAGLFANKINAQEVILNHISHRYFTYNQEIKINDLSDTLLQDQNNSQTIPIDSQDLIDVAKKAYGKNTIYLAHDFLIKDYKS